MSFVRQFSVEPPAIRDRKPLTALNPRETTSTGGVVSDGQPLNFNSMTDAPDNFK